MEIIVFDPQPARNNLLPLTYTRPVGDLRIGITTISEKWQRLLPGEYSWATEPYLGELFPCCADTHSALFVAGNVVPDANLAAAVATLGENESLHCGDTIVARRGDGQRRRDYTGEPPVVLQHVYDIFLNNGKVICADFEAITAGRTSQPLSPTVQVIGPRELVFVEEGASLECCVLNTTHGPIYIGQGATVMEGSLVRGPFALGDHATVNMGTKIYPDTTVGPWCKVGGELNNVVMHSYSNKAHDGFLGNAVVGCWCNLGAGCVASNLKNGYELIRLWNYPAHRFERTQLQFCGLIMGDHSKAGINTSFNTATVVGVGCNIYGSAMPRPFVASFSMGSAAGFTELPMAQFYATAAHMMERRGVELTEADKRMFEAVRDAADGL
ncbi:MAG: glucose-1-phosphate thymidylyltransferase [Muribaculaceae bacterium]|mgnify:CR=1 FL=1|nr:glucose-1-phosphate thymidylyltransferase [Muribaculaceae bacterium]